MLYYTVLLPTFWQGIILGTGSGILQINLISEQMQKNKKKAGTSSGEKLAETLNFKIATLLVIRSGRASSCTQSCAMLLIFIQLTVLQTKKA